MSRAIQIKWIGFLCLFMVFSMGCDDDAQVEDFPSAVLYGTVIDETGNPLSDAEIHLIYLFESNTIDVNSGGKDKDGNSVVAGSWDDEYDLGDLDQPYPTNTASNGGPAHVLSDIAYLGSNVTGESEPIVPDGDFDDGVRLFDLILEDPCPTAVLRTQIVGGNNYGGQPLFLNIWIDGNDDGDFDDEHLCGEEDRSEWWVANRDINPGIYLDTLLMPAENMTETDFRAVRVRLSGEPLGRSGYTGVDDILGEVEDYWLGISPEAAVELVSFEGDAGNEFCRLFWQTSSENGNHHFKIYRAVDSEGPWVQIASVPGNGIAQNTNDYSYSDCGVLNEVTFYYKLATVSMTGQVVDLSPIVILLPSEELSGAPPGEFQPVYPNPSEGSVHIPFTLQCSRRITVIVESADTESLDTLWSDFPREFDYEITWDGGNLPNGVFNAKILTLTDDLGEQLFFINRTDPNNLLNVEPLYTTGPSGTFQFGMTRTKWQIAFESRDEDNNPAGNIMLDDRVVVVATKSGYSTAWDTVAVTPGITSEVMLILQSQ